MLTPKYLFTTYVSALDALTTIGSWLVNTMGYTQNLAPTADSVTYTGYKAHYQHTFITGETLYLNFHTDTAGSKLYLTASRAYSVSDAWNAQTGKASVLSGAVIYGVITIPTTSSNNSLYLLGDSIGNCQVFVQRGTNISASDFMQWGILDKSGFGTWSTGLYFGSVSMISTILSAFDCGPYLHLDTLPSYAPRGAIDISMDSLQCWAGVKSFSSSNGVEPSTSIGTTSANWSSIIVGSSMADGYINSAMAPLPTLEANGNIYYSHPSYCANVVEDIIGTAVNSITGKISLLPAPTIYARHEATQRLSPIGRIPFGYHCPIAGYYQFVAPGTQLVQDGRTFIMIGNIAAEMVSV